MSSSHTYWEDWKDPARPLLTFWPRGRHTSTVVILHGLGDTAYGWKSGAEFLAASCRETKFVLPTAPTVRVGLMSDVPAPAWCDIPDPRSDPAGMLNLFVDKPGRIDAAVYEVAKLVRHESKQHGIPPSRIVIVGFSQGGQVASWVAMQLRLALAGLVILSSAVFGSRHMRMSEVYRSIPVLYCHGTNDPVLPLQLAHHTRGLFEDCGVKVQYHEDDVGHTTSQEAFNLVSKFLTEKLPDADVSAPALCDEAARAAMLEELLPLSLRPDDGRIPDDTHVTVRGLKSQAQHNGAVGVIVGYNAVSGRHTVRLPGVQTPVALRPENLTQHVANVVLLGDGSVGTVLDFDDKSLLFQVRVSDECDEWGRDVLRAELPNELRPLGGTAVRIVGLKSEKGQLLNERVGYIGSLEQQRYSVQVEGEWQKILPANLRYCGGGDGSRKFELREAIPNEVRLPRGTAVRIAGLKSERGQLLNEQVGCITAFSEEDQRYAVQIGNDRHKVLGANLRCAGSCVGFRKVEVRAVAADMLRLPRGSTVRVTGLKSEAGRPLNGRLGPITGFSEQDQRYIVLIGSEKHKIRPTNVQP